MEQSKIKDTLETYHLDIVIIIWGFINCPTVICLPTVCYFLREATSEIYDPGSILYHICFLIYFLLHLFSDLLFQKPKNTLLHFFFTYFILHFIELYSPKLIQIYISFYQGGIDNPYFTSGCKYLFFVCRYCLHSVAWFSYWIDTLFS